MLLELGICFRIKCGTLLTVVDVGSQMEWHLFTLSAFVVTARLPHFCVNSPPQRKRGLTEVPKTCPGESGGKTGGIVQEEFKVWA